MSKDNGHNGNDGQDGQDGQEGREGQDRPESPGAEAEAHSAKAGAEIKAIIEALIFASPEPLTLSSHPYMFQDFAGAVREGRDPLVTGEQGRWAIELVNGITLSHVLGRRVGLPLDRDEYDRVLAQLVAHPLPRTELPA